MQHPRRNGSRIVCFRIRRLLHKYAIPDGVESDLNLEINLLNGAVCITTCGKTATVNNTYWANPGYSTAITNGYTTPGQCTLNIKKVSTDICQIRYHQLTQLSGVRLILSILDWISWISSSPIRAKVTELPLSVWPTHSPSPVRPITYRLFVGPTPISTVIVHLLSDLLMAVLTVAAKSIRTPAVSPSDSSVKDPFLPSHNSAKKRFQELKKNQWLEVMLEFAHEFFQNFSSNSLTLRVTSKSIRTAGFGQKSPYKMAFTYLIFSHLIIMFWTQSLTGRESDEQTTGDLYTSVGWKGHG